MKRIIVIIFLFIVFCIPIYKQFRQRNSPEPENIPNISMGTSQEDLYNYLGKPYCNYNRIKVWKNDSWTLVGVFSNSSMLDDYAIFNSYNKYVHGTTEPMTLKDAVTYIFKTPDNRMDSAYNVDSGYGTMGILVKEGAIVMWNGKHNLSVYDIRDNPYTEYPLWFYIIKYLFIF